MARSLLAKVLGLGDEPSSSSKKSAPTKNKVIPSKWEPAKAPAKKDSPVVKAIKQSPAGSKGESSPRSKVNPAAGYKPSPSRQSAIDRGDKTGEGINPFTIGQESKNIFGQALFATAGKDGAKEDFEETVKRTTPRTGAKATAEKKAQQKEASEAFLRKVDARALGSVTGTKELTWEEYSALSPAKRAAIDANSAIVEAVETDKANEGKSGTGAPEDYDSTVKELFGKGGGSDTFAPETLALIQKLGLGNNKTGDLDNYLNLTALVTDKDLDTLDTPGAASPRAENARLFSTAAQSTLAKTLAQGQSLLESARGGNSWMLAPTDNQGGTVGDTLSQLFDYYASKDNSATITNEDMEADLEGTTAELGIDRNAISRYFQDRITALEYDTAAPRTGGFGDYVDPAEFRTRFLQGGQ